MSSAERYDRHAAAQRQLPAIARTDKLDMHEAIRLGTLAASSHNTQPWRVRIGGQRLTVAPDFTRRCPVVDPDDSHLFKSLGCMVENIEVAAAAQGFSTDRYFDSNTIHLTFHSAPPSDSSELYNAIAQRQCTKTLYDGRPLSTQVRQALEAAGSGHGVRALFVDDSAGMEAIIEFVTRGNAAQLSDPAFKKELARWIRFNPRAALRMQDGLAGRVTAQPAVPQWLGRAILDFVLTPKGQSDTDARHIRSSAAVVVFMTQRDEPESWIELGRAYERFALTATALGIRNAFINQPIEVRRLRPQLNRWLGLDTEQAQLMVRVGHAPTAPFSLRRPLEAIIEYQTQD